MLSYLWNTFLYQPLLNSLVFLVGIMPRGDIGLAVVFLTILVKLILFPLSQKSLKSQVAMSALSPKLKEIKDSGLSKEEQAKKTFELYKEHKTNPFSGCLLVLIQIPIIIALYHVFFKGIDLASINLYSFITLPEYINTQFLGLIDISGKSLILAILAGVSQYLQAYFMPKNPTVEKKDKKTPESFQENFTKSMQTQMKYVFPFVVAFISYTVSGVVALYFVVSNMFSVFQQIYINGKNKKSELPNNK